ncbi:MAG: hypothetical protein IPI92_16555 [Gemmatimonadetes bacterium]|nr:hypothetical protein [Gemmatimonadota bacterium]MBK7786634.1 hypothetical protein [Gemmatimonadota bacterium]MBK9066039.1 hypothetical protein [Gemmatimonadota bacterium]
MRIVVLLCLGLLAGGTTPVRAQRPSSQTGTWLDAGLGGGNNGLNLLLGITRRSGIHSLSARGMVAARFKIVVFEKSSSRTFGDLGLLYGVNGRAGSALFYARAGVGAVWYRRENSDSTNTYQVSAEFGVPWEAGVTKVFGNNFGVGLRLAGNANTFRSNLAGLLVLHLGQVW